MIAFDEVGLLGGDLPAAVGLREAVTRPAAQETGLVAPEFVDQEIGPHHAHVVAIGIDNEKNVFSRRSDRLNSDFTVLGAGVDSLEDRTIEDARVVFGGIAGKPYRERAVEAFLKGKTLSADLANQAVAAALANAAPLKYNATKIDMAKGLLASGLDKLAAS